PFAAARLPDHSASGQNLYWLQRYYLAPLRLFAQSEPGFISRANVELGFYQKRFSRFHVAKFSADIDATIRSRQRLPGFQKERRFHSSSRDCFRSAAGRKLVPALHDARHTFCPII